MKKGWLIVAIIFWLVAIILPVVMCTSNDNEVKTVDLSAIRAKEIVAGTNLTKPDFECSIMSFLGKSYDLVMVGVEDVNTGKIVYLGKADNQWYKAEEWLKMGTTQKVEEAKIVDREFVVSCGKNKGAVVILTLLAVAGLGALGVLAFSWAKD